MKEEIFYIYRHIRLDKNEPFYIGMGKVQNMNSNTHKNYYSRAYNMASRTIFWKRVLEKSGYEVEIIFESNNRQLVIEKEIEFIALYGRRDLTKGILVNLTDGGEGQSNCIISKESKERRLKSYNDNKDNHIVLKGKNSPHAKKVIEIETGVIFNTLIEAAEYLGISLKNLSNQLKNPHRKNKTGFKYLDEKLNKSYIDKRLDKKVFDYNTGEIVESISKASKIYKMSSKTLSEYLLGNYKNKTNLVFYTDYLKGLKSNEIYNKPCRKLNKKVINIQTKDVYNSIKEALIASGLKKTTFSQKINNKIHNNTPYMLLSEYNKY